MSNLVLSSTRFLVENPRYVFINNEKLEEYASKLAERELEIPSWDKPFLLGGKSKEVIDFFFLGNSINFSFKHINDVGVKRSFETEYRGEPYRGAMAMWACLKRALEGDFPELLEGDFLRDISKPEMENIFQGKNSIPMLEERLAIFQEVGAVLYKKYDGRFHNLVEESNHRLFNNGKGLVEKLVFEFPSFNDSAMHEGKLVVFNKKAQLVPMMLYGRFRNQGDFVVDDIDKLTILADYHIPRQLRDSGVLVYEKSLAERIDNQVEIPKHSREELEIRASTIHVGEKVKNKLNEIKGNNAVNACHIDYSFFSGPKITGGSEHHLTRTIDY